MSNPGDIVWVSNQANADAVPNEGQGNLDLLWDRVDQSFSVVNVNGTFTLDTGIWSVSYTHLTLTTSDLV